MVLLDNDRFLTELSKLYQKTKTKGSLFVTCKRYVPKSTAEETTNTNTNTNTKPGKTEQDSAEPRILIRATDGTTKFSTHVAAKDLVKFQTSYANILKSQMDALKRKEKDKKKKKSAKMAV